MTIQEADRFLVKEFAEQFINQNSAKLFGHSARVNVFKIERSPTLNPTSYNILYTLRVGLDTHSIRAATSTIWEYDYNFNTLQLLYNNGFSQGDILVAKPLAFFPDRNLMFYENINGDQFKSKLDDDVDNLKSKVKFAARALRKIHQIKEVSFHLWDHNWSFDDNLISKNCPSIGDQVSNLRDKIMFELRSNKDKCLCHGDYQPGNIIFNQDKIYIIDWGSTTYSYKEMDIASFIAQLKVMLAEFKRESNFDILQNVFLAEYGSFDQRMFNYFEFLYNMRILNSVAGSSSDSSSSARINIACEEISKNLININET